MNKLLKDEQGFLCTMERLERQNEEQILGYNSWFSDWR